LEVDDPITGVVVFDERVGSKTGKVLFPAVHSFSRQSFYWFTKATANATQSERMFCTNHNRRTEVSRSCRLALAFLAVFAVLSSPGAREIRAAESDAPTESEVKAAMIYNFAQFVQWPGTNLKPGQAPFVIGIFGDDPIEAILDDTLKGETFQNRTVQVRQVSALSDAKVCDILFVSQSQKKHISEILEEIRGNSTLTVGDTEDFIPLGGMIAFKKEGNKVRFQINPDAAMRSGLKISSKLLHLAIPQDDGGAKGRN
jgi:hypothetical protein